MTHHPLGITHNPEWDLVRNRVNARFCDSLANVEPPAAVSWPLVIALILAMAGFLALCTIA